MPDHFAFITWSFLTLVVVPLCWALKEIVA